MSNLIPTNIQIPAYLANRMGQPSKLAQDIAGGLGGGESFPRISIKGSRFRIVEDGTETVLNSTTLDVITVGANPRLSKTWYAKAWTPDAEPSAPDCFSLDGVGPNPDSTNPQNDLCASCPHNAWGSKLGLQGQPLKACADQKRMAVVAADDPTGPIYLLQVTAAALKGLQAYQKSLTMRGIAPETVRTRISFDTDASFPKLTFSLVGFIDEELVETISEIANSDKVLEITGQKSIRPAAAIPAAAPKAAPVRPAPAPAPAPVEQPSATVVKRGFGAAAAPAPTPAAAPKATKAAKPAPVTAAASSATNLADEITALMGEIDADDA